MTAESENGFRSSYENSADRDRNMAEKIAGEAAALGGHTYYVGGCVRDLILGIDNKDIDIEVHGILPKQLEQILDRLGRRTEMGASFGVYGLRGFDLDIAMPRKEEATGRGHKDFKIYVDPFLGTLKAARRRDFTMNALMQDVLTGEIVDHFHGLEDLKEGVLRHVDADTFIEDPLRVLRAAQFAARFEFRLADETIELAKTMQLDKLARERIMGELEKALLKAKRPSIFFEELRKMEKLSEWFPELEKLIGLKQDPVHHPEGDVWTHTMLVVDRAAAFRKQTLDPVGFELAALTHDFGKILTSEEKDGRIHAYGHEEAGQPLIRDFLKRITNEVKRIKYVLNMDLLHMEPNIMAAARSKIKSTNHLFDRSVDPKGLILLAKADHLGRSDALEKPEDEAFLWERLTVFEETMAKPYVMGADLVAAGLKPGPKFSEILDYAHKLRLACVDKDTALKQTLAYAKEIL